MLKIILICFDFSDKNIYKQPWNFAWHLINSLKKQGNKVFVITDTYENNSLAKDFEILSVSNTLYQKRKFSREVENIVSDIQPNIILYMSGFTDVFRPFLFKSFKYPVIPIIGSPIYRLRDLAHLSFREWLKHFRYIRYGLLSALIPLNFLKLTFFKKKVVALVTLSPENFEIFSKIFGKKLDVLLIPPPIHSDFLKVSVPNNKKISDKILYFGPPLSFRGFDTLLQAVHILKSKYPHKNLELILLSRVDKAHLAEEEKEMLNMIEKLNLEEITKIYSGLLTRKEIINHLLNANIVVLPFKYVMSEVPLVNIEAAALGRPVISTKLPSINQYTKMLGGQTVSPNNPQKLANAMEKFLLMGGPINYKEISENFRKTYPPIENGTQLILELLRKRYNSNYEN
jgi:glycosyltransferase involved in cell wall biosynthesis